MDRDGKYYDGKSPVSRPVKCFLISDELVIIHSETEERLSSWKRSGIFKDKNHNTAVVIGNILDKSRIELTNLELAKQLHFDSSYHDKKGFLQILGWASALVVILFVFWIIFPIATSQIAQRIPFEYEVKFAKGLQINNHFKICKMTHSQEAALKFYTDFLYGKTANEKQMPITVEVSNDFLVNAFTLPGGKIILMKGLLDEVKTPEELLGIMGHEMGHVIHRDSAKFLVRSTLSTSMMGFLTGDFSGTFGVSPEVFFSTVLLSYDRDMEVAADTFAAERLNLVNVSTSGLRSFFIRRKNDVSSSIPDILNTHPNYDKRLKLIVETYPKIDLPIEITQNWKVIKGICSN